MNVTLDTSDVTVPATFRNRLIHRVSGLFFRFSDSVRSLHVSLKDVNGPKGGEDKVCQLSIELTGGGQIIVREKSNRLVKSMGKAARRARSLVAKQIKKRRPRRVSLKRLEAVTA